jgi:hypothetical protein
MLVETAMVEIRERENLDRPPEYDVKSWAMLTIDEAVVTRKLTGVDRRGR